MPPLRGSRAVKTPPILVRFPIDFSHWHLAEDGTAVAGLDNPMDRVAGFYRFLWPFLAAEESQVGWLDENTGGRSNRDFLAEVPARYRIGPGMTLLDLGCGKGREACALAKQLGCRVIGVDALPGTLQLARDRISGEGLAGQVSLVCGSMDALPLPDASVDFIWCRDTLNHTSDMARTLAECARVLRPAGRMMSYSALKTDWLEPGEERRVTRPLGINPATLVATQVAEAFHAAGLRILEQATTDQRDSRYHEELDPNGGRDVMRLARILHARERITALLGAEDYERLVAYYLWNCYLLIGKLIYGVWVGQADGAESSRSVAPVWAP
jgi:ubiquinone/menaquinone biosynthesis C-methylase UbiE